jgi:phage terminase small subunit
MANRPKPKELRLLEGNRGHRPIPETPQPRSKHSFPYAPRHLSEIAKKEWRTRGKELFRLGLLTILDIPAFEAYCEWYAEFHEAQSLTAKKEAGHQMRMFLTEFGMTPSSRTKVDVDKLSDDESEWDELIGVR